MNDINNTFFELIQVAIGTRICLSHTPSADEWGELYKMTKKQSLVGVCFAGVQKLQTQRQEPPEMLYLTWMGMAAKIQQRNEVVNRQCVELQARLSADGFKSCILKGQSIAQLYDENLRGLRQSGDIDVWVKEPFERIMDYVQKVAPTKEVNRMHAKLEVFHDTEVEVHFTPVRLKCPWRDRKLQKWFASFDVDKFEMNNGFQVAPIEMNVVFILLHIFKHLFNEGIGLRQVMDYYFVSLAANKEVKNGSEWYGEIKKVITDHGLDKFAAAMMYIMHVVFGLQREQMLCEPDEKLGRKILEDIMQRGNFGHGDERVGKNEGTLKRFARTTCLSLKYLHYFTAEVVWLPWYRLSQRFWMFRYGYK